VTRTKSSNVFTSMLAVAVARWFLRYANGEARRQTDIRKTLIAVLRKLFRPHRTHRTDTVHFYLGVASSVARVCAPVCSCSSHTGEPEKNGCTDRDAARGTLTWAHVGAHWRHLANTTDRSVRGGDASFCRITLFTFVQT